MDAASFNVDVVSRSSETIYGAASNLLLGSSSIESNPTPATSIPSTRIVEQNSALAATTTTIVKLNDEPESAYEEAWNHSIGDYQLPDLVVANSSSQANESTMLLERIVIDDLIGLANMCDVHPIAPVAETHTQGLFEPINNFNPIDLVDDLDMAILETFLTQEEFEPCSKPIF